MNRTRKASLAILAGITVTGIVGAAAASFGGMSAASLGSERSVVASCDDDGIDVDFATAHVAGDYVVTSVELSGVAADCDGLSFSVTLSDGSGAELDSASGTVALASGAFGAAVADVPAGQVEGVALVISG